MKRIVWISVLVAALAGWAWAGSSIENQTRIEIEAPPEVVFAYATEPEHLKRWLEGLIESKPEGSAALRVGARSTEVVEMNGERVEMAMEVLSVSAPHEMTVQLQTDIMTATNRYQLESTPHGTSLQYDALTEMKGLWRFVGLVMHGPIQEKNDADFARLKALVEAEAGAPTSG